MSEYTPPEAGPNSDPDPVLDENKPIVLEPELFDRFMAACEKAPPPNAALKRASIRANDSGIE